MTKKEAIAAIKTLCHTCKFFPKCVNDKPECFQAIEMAIEALKQPEIIYCKDCVHHIDGFFCQAANHHTSDKDCCAIVFGAERREQ